MLREGQMADTVAEVVVQARAGLAGAERAPKRVAETPITAGVVAAGEGGREQAVRRGGLACTGLPRASAFIDHGEGKRR